MTRIRYAPLALVVAALAGCVGAATTNREDSDAQKVAQVVRDAEDVKHAPARLKELFASDATPPKAKRLEELAVRVKDAPSVSGDRATATVEFVSERSGAVTGQTEWTFVKEGNTWKIKAAPLP